MRSRLGVGDGAVTPRGRNVMLGIVWPSWVGVDVMGRVGSLVGMGWVGSLFGCMDLKKS